MTAQQWLDDLEAKADSAILFVPVPPAEAKRIVAMMRVLADMAGNFYSCLYECNRADNDCSKCMTEAVYKQTEPTNDD